MILQPEQIIDNKWHVVYLIKENPYAEINGELNMDFGKRCHEVCGHPDH